MKPKAKLIFNPKSFLAKVGKGRTHTDHPKNQKVFSQGDAAQAIFYLQKGKVKLTVVSQQGKEAVIAILGAGDFWRGLPGRPTTAHVNGDDNVRVLNRADR